MAKSKAKLGVSRRVKLSVLGPQGSRLITTLNQSALVRWRETAAKTRLDFLQGTPFQVQAFHCQASYLIFYIGLGDEGKRLLEEFGGAPSTGPADTADSSPTVEDQEPWVALGQEGVAHGSIDDIQGLLDGK
jgi:hypothetical protein